MKFGKFELLPWKWHVTHGCGPDNKTVCGWFKNISYDYCSTMPGCIAIYTTEVTDIWEIKFWYELDFLNKIHNCKLIIGSQDEVKKKIDDFLLRINNLRIFC